MFKGTIGKWELIKNSLNFLFGHKKLPNMGILSTQNEISKEVDLKKLLMSLFSWKDRR